MLVINLNNIEDLIFYDQSLKKKLPELSYLFSQWAISKKVPSLRFLGKKSLLDLLNQLDGNYLKVLESHFNVKVSVDKFDYHVVKHLAVSLEEAEEKLKEIKGYYYSTYREDDYLYISFWR